MWRYHVVMIGALALSGCANNISRPAVPVTLQEAMQKLNADLAKIPHLNASDLLSDERGQRYEATKKFIHDKQCSVGSANPVLVISLPTMVNLKGSLEPNGSARISGAGDRFEIPLRIAGLVDLPNEYLKDMAALMESKSLPEELAKKLKKELPETYEKLTSRVSNLLNSFDPRSCSRMPRQREFLDRERLILFVPPTF